MLEEIKQKIFYIIVASSLVVAAIGYWYWQIDPDMVGVVESRFHNIGAREDGLIDKFLVEVGTKVEAGQILARLDITDLIAEQKQLEEELQNLSDSFKADKIRFEIESEKLLLQVKTETSVLSRHFAEYKAKLAEVVALDAEIKRLQDAENAGLGRTRDLADLVIQRESAKSFIVERRKAIAKNRNKSLKKNRADSNKEDFESLLLSQLGDRLAQIDNVKLGLTIINERMRNRLVISPCVGYVTDVLFRKGDTVQAYNPVLTIEDADVSFVTAYVPEVVRSNAKNGQPVAVYLKSTGALGAEGHISFVHPGYSPIPPRLTFRGQEVWARKIRIKLDSGHTLLPGEAVRVSLVGNRDIGFGTDEVQAAPAKKKTMILKAIDVPQQISTISPFEPSGLIWLDDIQRYLVISDDTGLKSKNAHVPWLFFMTASGLVEKSPVVLNGVQSLNDLEAITQSPDGTIYLVSSQNISKKGKRPANRFQLLKVKRNGRELVVLDNIALLPTILKSLTKEKLTALGLVDLETDGLPILNIEAAAFFKNNLYFGLKQPNISGKAIIWKLTNPDSLFANKKLEDGQVSLETTLELSETGEVRGISDMLFDESGNLYLLSTIPKIKTKKQKGLLFKVNNKNGQWLEPKVLQRFDGVKPEGIAFSSNNKLMIVFDADNQNPQYTLLEVE